MTYGSAQPWMITDEAESFKQLKHAYDAGINVSAGVCPQADRRHSTRLMCTRLASRKRS